MKKIKMNENYKIFTDNLYKELENIDELVRVKHDNSKENYWITYTNYSELNYEDEEYVFDGAESENNSKLKTLCDIVLSSLEKKRNMPDISLDNYSGNILLDNNMLLFYFNFIKEKADRDLLYEKIYKQFPPKEWLESIHYFQDKDEPIKKEIIDYIFEKLEEKKDNPKMQFQYLINILSSEHISFINQYRDNILTTLENCYSEFLEYDIKKDDKTAYHYRNDDPRHKIVDFINKHEPIEQWYSYKKFTIAGRYENENITNEVISECDFVLESLHINQKALIMKYPLLLTISMANDMINSVIKSLKYGKNFYGITNLDTLHTSSEHGIEIWLKIEKNYDVEQSLNAFKTIFPQMCEYYQDNILINKKLSEHEKEKLLKKAFEKILLDYKVPLKEDIPIKRLKL